MSSRRYKDDAVLASIIHYIISGVFFITGTVFFILTMNGNVHLASLYAIFWGMAFINLSNIKAIYDDYDISNKFVRILLGIFTAIGIVALLGGIIECVNVSHPYPYIKVFAFSVIIGSVMKVFIENINDFIPAFDKPESEFFRYHSWLIFVGGTLAFFSIMYIFFDFYFTLLLIGNWILAYFVFSAFRTWMETKEVKNLIYAIIFFVIGIGVNLPIALAVNNLANLSATLAEANLFNLASNLYFALSIVMGIGFCFLTRLDFVKSNMSESAVEILLLTIPVISFGIQFLAFFYFEAFLIVAGSVLLFIALIVLLFKVFLAVVSWIGDAIVTAANAVWYVISFKWITNQVSVLTSRDDKPRSSVKESHNCSDCKYCSVETKYQNGDTDTWCSYHNKWCNTLFDTDCNNFERR